MSRRLAAAAGVLGLAVSLGACAAHKPEADPVEYETRVSTSIAPATGDSAAAAAPSFTPQAELRALEVRRASASSGTRLVVQLSRTPTAIHPFELSHPRRCVIDVDGPAVAAKGQQTIATGDPLAPRIRVGSHPGRLRLVVDVEPGVAASCESRLESSAVVVALGEQPRGGMTSVAWTAPGAPEDASAHAAWALARATGDQAGAAAAGPEVAAISDPPEADAAPALGSRTPELPGRPAQSPSLASAPPAPQTGVSPPIEAAPDPPPGMPADGAQRRYTGRRVSLEFKDADILNVLRILADVAQRNIVATDDVKGRVTIVLRDVPWDQALDILLKSTGLEQVEFDEVITVSTAKRLEEERKARLAARQAGQELEPLRTDYIRINYVKAADLANILQGGISTSGAASVAAAQISQQGVLGNAPLGDTAAQRRGLLSSRGSVQVNDATNTLIVRDIADGIASARELVRKLDVQTPQVAIQGLIFEGDTNIDRSLGIRWGAKYKASPETGNPTGKNFPGRVTIGGEGPSTSVGEDGQAVSPIMFDFPASGVRPGAGTTLGLLLGSLSGSSQIDAQITALEEAGKGKVISRPKVITLNNTEATIEALEILRVRLPSTGTVINTGAGGAAGSQTTATQAIDTGIILRVTPQVSSDGYILMQLFVKSSVPSEVSTDDIPNEISRQATSQVLVREGETVVIGGVYRQRANRDMQGVPWLSSIPVLGWLFKSTLDKDRRQEMLVFITPRVVWRTGGDQTLPSSTELWDKRALSAYPGEPPGGGTSAQPAPPPTEG